MAAPPSSEQLKVDPPSVDVKAKFAVVAATVPAGAQAIVVSGGVVSGSGGMANSTTNRGRLPDASRERNATPSLESATRVKP